MLATLILLVWLNILYYTLMMSCLRKLSGVLGGGYTRVYGVYQPPGFFDSVYSPQ